MRRLHRIVTLIAPKEVVVTLVGESGTGKEILARRVHEQSQRCAGPFVPINCAAIPDSLFESELFGHERGAFTGAATRAKGKLEAAAGGTLFLDEIGEMPLGVQAKLLRFLENRKFMRVGGSAKISVDTRLVCATLRPLDAEVRAGRFRADLFYRIQGITLDVPPLRERRADIAPLVRQLVAQISAKHGTAPPRMTRDALAALSAYAWPGNVRELKNVIEHVALLREGKRVRARDLPFGPGVALLGSFRPGRAAVASGAEVLQVRLDRPLSETIDAVLCAALDLEGGSRSAVARRLGISLRTVQRHVARRPEAFASGDSRAVALMRS